MKPVLNLISAPTIPYFVTSSKAIADGVSTLSISYPTGIQAGDLLFIGLIDSYRSSGASAPSGWTEAIDHKVYYSSGITSYSCYRIATGSESGSVNLPKGNTSGSALACMTVWRGVNQTTPVNFPGFVYGGLNITNYTIERYSSSGAPNNDLNINYILLNDNVIVSGFNNWTKQIEYVENLGKDLALLVAIQDNADAYANDTLSWGTSEDISTLRIRINSVQ